MRIKELRSSLGEVLRIIYFDLNNVKVEYEPPRTSYFVRLVDFSQRFWNEILEAVSDLILDEIFYERRL